MRYWKNSEVSICPIPDPDQNRRETIRQRRGTSGFQRGRRWAARSERCRLRCPRSYRADPHRVKPSPVCASEPIGDGLKEFARRGGHARARKYTEEQLRAWGCEWRLRQKPNDCPDPRVGPGL